jgi:hypothetical protein
MTSCRSGIQLQPVYGKGWPYNYCYNPFGLIRLPAYAHWTESARCRLVQIYNELPKFHHPSAFHRFGRGKQEGEDTVVTHHQPFNAVPTVKSGVVLRLVAFCREEVLQEAEKERVARRLARERLQSAVKIQSAWRGYRSRSATQQLLLLEWQAVYAPAAGQAELQLTGQQILEQLVPLLLGSLMPSWSRRTRKLLSSGDTLGLDQQRHTWPGAPAGCAPSPDAVARGSLLLLMRSITSSDPLYNYCTAACSTDAKVGEGEPLQSQALNRWTLSCALA